MKAAERNDSSDVSAQGRASINLQKWRVTVGGNRVKTCGRGKTIRNSPGLSSFDCTLRLLSTARERALHHLKERLEIIGQHQMGFKPPDCNSFIPVNRSSADKAKYFRLLSIYKLSKTAPTVQSGCYT